MALSMKTRMAMISSALFGVTLLSSLGHAQSPSQPAVSMKQRAFDLGMRAARGGGALLGSGYRVLREAKGDYLSETPERRAVHNVLWASVLFPRCTPVSKGAEAVGAINGGHARGHTLFGRDTIGLIYWIAVNGTPSQKQRLTEVLEPSLRLKSVRDEDMLNDLARRIDGYVGSETSNPTSVLVHEQTLPGVSTRPPTNVHNATELDLLRRNLRNLTNMESVYSAIRSFHVVGGRGTQPFESSRLLVEQSALEERGQMTSASAGRAQECQAKKEWMEDNLENHTYLGMSARNWSKSKWKSWSHPLDRSVTADPGSY